MGGEEPLLDIGRGHTTVIGPLRGVARIIWMTDSESRNSFRFLLPDL